MRRRRTLCVPMPGSCSPTALTEPASERYRSRPSKRTSLGADSSGGWRPKLPSCAFKLLEGPPKAKVTPVGCAVGPPITGQLTLEGIPVLGLVDTGTSVTCMGFSVWWQYCTQWGPLKPFGGIVHGAHEKPLQIAGKTQHLDLQWGEARGRACFIVIVGLESPPCLIGMDIMRPLRVRIDVTNGTATLAQPDPQPVHLNAAQQQKVTAPPRDTAPQPLSSPPPEIAPPPAAPHTASSALLLQTADIPAETARLVCCHNPWPAEDVCFCPEDALPAFVTGVPALSSGSELWIAIHNHRPEPLRLHSGQNIGVLEVVTVANAPSSTSKPGPMHQPPVPEHFPLLQQQQLNKWIAACRNLCLKNFTRSSLLKNSLVCHKHFSADKNIFSLFHLDSVL